MQRANEGQVLPRSLGLPRARARQPQSLSEPKQEPIFLLRRGRLEAWNERSEPPCLSRGSLQLFCNGEVHAIDFDGCGWGYYLFDIGVAFSTLLARNDYRALRQAFLEGYRRVRPFSVSHEALIDTFIAARLMCHVLWLAAHVDEPSYGLRAIRRIEYELGELKGFLNG